jgi:hypothetical protein
MHQNAHKQMSRMDRRYSKILKGITECDKPSEDFPFDEAPPAVISSQRASLQTFHSMQAVTDAVPGSLENHENRSQRRKGIHLATMPPSLPPLPLFYSPPTKLAMQPPNGVESIGEKNLGIYRMTLPPALRPLLNPILSRVEEHASKRTTGWKTNLYSLTQQDLPLSHVPGCLALSQPLTDYLVRHIQRLYAPNSHIVLDCNQPHVLKYGDDHRAVPLHYDRCSVTAQLSLSDYTTDYTGGGTFFPDAQQTIKLKRGDILFHPGSLVHSGQEIFSGERYLMIWFCQIE